MEQTTPVEPTNKSNKFWFWVILIVIPVGILAYIVMNRPSNISPQPTPMTINNSVIDTIEQQSTNNAVITNDTNQVSEPVIVGSYKDGSYSATGDYISPGGPEEIKLTLTVKDGTVTDSVFLAQSERPISQKFQKQFSDGYKEYVIGKKIDEIQITKVSGSSLTPKGFNDALAKIKAEAKL